MNATKENDHAREGAGHPAPQGAGDGAEQGLTRDGDGVQAIADYGARAGIVASTEQALSRLRSGIASSDDFLLAMNLKKRMGEIMRECMANIETAGIEWLDKNGEVECGDVRYYVGRKRNTRCMNQAETAKEILNASGGDLDALNKCLAAGAFKPGATAEVLDEETYKRLFKTEEVPDLLTGRPKKVLNTVNQSFLRKGK